ncbi:MAG: hypothetical protein ACRDI2_10795, partial [Chloroflexota bacterium]
PTRSGVGPFEAALGFAPCWARRWGEECWASTLAAEPGACWDYTDPAFAHLGIAFTHLAGQQLRDFMQERVFAPIGIDIFRVADGRLAELWQEEDSLGLWRQLGLLPPIPEPTHDPDSAARPPAVSE